VDNWGFEDFEIGAGLENGPLVFRMEGQESFWAVLKQMIEIVIF
jgi:hypothetical protein